MNHVYLQFRVLVMLPTCFATRIMVSSYTSLSATLSTVSMLSLQPPWYSSRCKKSLQNNSIISTDVLQQRGISELYRQLWDLKLLENKMGQRGSAISSVANEMANY